MFKKILFLFLILLAIVFLPVLKTNAQEKIYLIEIKFDSGQINFEEISTKLGYAPEPEKPDFMGENKYWIELLSFSDKILEKRMFSISQKVFYDFKVTDEQDPGGGVDVLKQIEHLLILPYYKDGKTLKLYDTEMNLLDKRDVGFLADVCGDGICQEHESYEDCDKDCAAAAKDDYCNEEKMEVDPDCEGWPTGVTDTDKTNGKTFLIYYFAAGVVIILLIISGFVSIRKKRRIDNNYMDSL